MRRFLDITAKALSILLYPLFLPTYGVALFCYAYSLQVNPLPIVWIIVALCGTLLLTCLLPMSAILIMIRKGKVQDIQIANPVERTFPYLYAALGFGFWSYLFMKILHAPVYICTTTVGATIAIAIVALINRRWKISAHLTAMGGLFGGLLTYCLGIGAIPTWVTIIVWLAITLSLMFSRLWLKAHTPAQVAAGWLLGITCVYLYGLVYMYVA